MAAGQWYLVYRVVDVATNQVREREVLLSADSREAAIKEAQSIWTNIASSKPEEVSLASNFPGANPQVVYKISQKVPFGGRGWTAKLTE